MLVSSQVGTSFWRALDAGEQNLAGDLAGDLQAPTIPLVWLRHTHRGKRKWLRQVTLGFPVLCLQLVLGFPWISILPMYIWELAGEIVGKVLAWYGLELHWTPDLLWRVMTFHDTPQDHFISPVIPDFYIVPSRNFVICCLSPIFG